MPIPLAGARIKIIHDVRKVDSAGRDSDVASRDSTRLPQVQL
ncbi:MAG: hypothetical protein ACK56I_23770 [bacterium]